jgi:hypothetical protein
MSDDLIFIMLRNIPNEKFKNIWIESYNSIRKFYPTKFIYIIDSTENKEYIENIETTNCIVFNSEIPNGRLFAPYYYYLKYLSKYKKAVIIHDGIIFQQCINFDSIELKFLWHFETHEYDNTPVGFDIINNLENNEELKYLYQSKKWYGTLGCMIVIEYNILQKIQEKYNILKLSTVITNKEYACEFERILSVLCYSEYNFNNTTSLFGDISNMEWGLQLNNYLENKEKYSNYPLVKIFGAR